MSDVKKDVDPAEESKLNELLDSALEDFNKTNKSDEESDSETSVPLSSDDLETSGEESWANDFVKQAADQFEKNLQNLMENGADTELGISLKKMAETVATAITDNESIDSKNVHADFQSAISQALKDLTATSENLQSEPDLKSLFGDASFEEVSEVWPFMKEMMQTLLSKDILYPSLKEVVDKYPQWLEEKKETLSDDDLHRYTKQFEIMQKVCNEFEQENDNDSEGTKRQRFDMILKFMQDMQTYGSPPEDLVGSQPSLFHFDGEGSPVIPSLPHGVEAPQNCCLM